MKAIPRVMGYAIAAALASGAAAIAFWFLAPPEHAAKAASVPRLSELAKAGMVAFEANCAQCHGKNGSGTDKGPPLIHPVYHPGHHGDAAFVLAAKQGVRQHHWRFGNMPAQTQVTDEEIAAIVRYVREVQAAKGIGTRPSGT